MDVRSSHEQRDRGVRVALRVRRVCRHSRSIVGALVLTLAAVSMFIASRASAHATPHVLDMVFRQNGYVLLSNRGLIFGDKDRANWRLMCAEALGINTTEVPSFVGLPDGRLMVGTSRGLTVTADDGCSWQPVAPFGETSVPAMIVDSTDPKRIYLGAYASDPTQADVGGLYVSEDAGGTFLKLMAATDHEFLRTIRQAPSDPKHIYATGLSWDAMGKYTYYITQSLDAGKTWERTDVPLEMGELELQLFAVSPTDPNVLAVRAGGSNPMVTPERLLISKDGGKTFTSPISMLLLSAAAFSADGKTAWVVGQDGLFESTDALTTFKQIGSAISMSYVTERDGDVLACGYYAGAGMGINGIGTAKKVDDGFMSFMQLGDVRAPVACDPSSETAMKCAPWWVDWQNELAAGQFTGVDGGVLSAAGSGATGLAGMSALDAGVAGAAGSQPTAAAAGAAGAAGSVLDASVPPAPPAKSGGGCAVAAPGTAAATHGAFVAAALAFVAWSRRRKSRRRKSSTAGPLRSRA